MADFKALQGQATRRDVIKGTLKAGMYAAPVIAVGAIPFAASAVTGPNGVSFLVNGANSATAIFGTSFTLLGQNIPAGTVVFRVLQRISSPNANTFTFSAPVTIDATKTYFESVFTAGSNIIGFFGPGTYQAFLTTVQPTATNNGGSGALTGPLTITVTAQGTFAQPGTVRANAQEG